MATQHPCDYGVADPRCNYERRNLPHRDAQSGDQQPAPEFWHGPARQTRGIRLRRCALPPHGPRLTFASAVADWRVVGAIANRAFVQPLRRRPVASPLGGAGDGNVGNASAAWHRAILARATTVLGTVGGASAIAGGSRRGED